ncbi:MAG: hypothetical protein WCF84_00050 [Anaerolineae bacterium]
MSFFTPTDLSVFSESHAADPAYDLERVRLRDRLADLHGQIYPEMRTRRWDLHPHWTPRYLISTARLEPPHTRIDFLLLRYGKAETVVRLMKKELGEDFAHPYSTILLGVRIQEDGLALEMLLTHRAWADAQNFKNKLAQGAPEKKHLRQLFAELGANFSLSLESATRQELLRARCSRLVHLGTLDATLAKYEPGVHQLRVAIHYNPDDPRLQAEALPAEVLLRFGQLYLLYQFTSWSPRNDFLSSVRSSRRQQPAAAADPARQEPDDDLQKPNASS